MLRLDTLMLVLTIVGLRDGHDSTSQIAAPDKS
jgi:hypothetical protein